MGLWRVEVEEAASSGRPTPNVCVYTLLCEANREGHREESGASQVEGRRGKAQL